MKFEPESDAPPALHAGANPVNSAAMRLTHLALGLTLILLGVTGYLAWEGQQEARGARQQLEFIRNQQQAQTDAGAVPAGALMRPPQPGQIADAPPAQLATAPSMLPAPPKSTPPATTLAQPPPGLASLPPASPVLAAPAPAPLTALQKQIVAMPTIAKVKQFEKDAGFVIISAGKSQRISKGTQFDLRRENAIVGRITIGDSIEDEEAVGDLDPGSVPAGVIVQAGDEVIQMVNL